MDKMGLGEWMPEFVSDVNTNTKLLKKEAYQLYLAAKKQAMVNKQRQDEELKEKYGVLAPVAKTISTIARYFTSKIVRR